MSARAWAYRRVCKRYGHLLTWDGFYLRGRDCKRCYRCHRKIVHDGRWRRANVEVILVEPPETQA